MLIPMAQLFHNYGVRPGIVAHVGAHNGEELDQYSSLGIEKVYWFEANPNQVKILESLFEPMQSQILVPNAVWDTDGEILNFKITSNSLSSSMFELGTHSSKYPDIVLQEEVNVTTLRLDSYFQEKDKPDFINLDIQGAELKALLGAREMLKEVSFVYSEVSYEELYINAPLADEIEVFLNGLGFKRVMTRKLRQDGWGDVLYVNKKIAKLPKSRVIARALRNLIYFLHSEIYSIRLKLHSWRSTEKKN